MGRDVKTFVMELENIPIRDNRAGALSLPLLMRHARVRGISGDAFDL